MPAGWKLMRVKDDFSDDPDYAACQIEPVDQIPLNPLQSDQLDRIVGLAVVVEWLDASGDPVDTGCDRGEFDIQFIEIAERLDGLGGNIVMDSVVKTNQLGFRRIVIDAYRGGDSFSVRLLNIVSPGGAAAKLRVLYRDM
jgi:hypothetical protein